MVRAGYHFIRQPGYCTPATHHQSLPPFPPSLWLIEVERHGGKSSSGQWAIFNKFFFSSILALLDKTPPGEVVTMASFYCLARPVKISLTQGLGGRREEISNSKKLLDTRMEAQNPLRDIIKHCHTLTRIEVTVLSSCLLVSQSWPGIISWCVSYLLIRY